MASIFLAVGHGVQTDGTWDSGCTYNGITEAELAKGIVGYAIPVLRAHGADVHTDYPENDMNITTCVEYANVHNVDTYVSIHCDFSGAPSGTLPIVHPNSSRGYMLAQCMNSNVTRLVGIGTRGILKRDDWEVSGTDMPACIFEVGSIRADLARIQNAKVYGQAIAYGILDYFGIAHDQSTPVQPSQPSQPSKQFVSIYDGIYYLSYGDGPDPNIGQFQRDCILCGYWGSSGPLVVDNLYGSECEYACMCIQRFHGLTVDGKFGHDTDIALMKEVASIQEALNKYGYNLVVDGVAGDATVKALKDFQKRNGLSVDGICGDKTRALLGIR